MIEVPLKNSNLTTLIDEEDADLAINGLRPSPYGYVFMCGEKPIFLHVAILERIIDGKIPPGYETDHINRDKLDNRRSNLRLATPTENGRNKPPLRGKKYKGVIKEGNTWRVSISKSGIRIEIGKFITEESAALAYDNAARCLDPNFAYLNFPDKVVTNKYLNQFRSTVVGKPSSSSIRGISWNKKERRWRIRTSINGVMTYVGSTKDWDEAVKMLNEAKSGVNHAI